MNTIRFWEFMDGRWQGIELAHEGDSVEFSDGGDHEEGWSSSYSRFTHRGDHVEYQHDTDGTDCDGRHSTSQEFRWDGETMRDLGHVPEAPQAPEWEPVQSGQRDYTAESAGY